MRLVSYRSGGQQASGLLLDDSVIDIGVAVGMLCWDETDMNQSRSVRGLLELGKEALADVENIVNAHLTDIEAAGGKLPVAKVTLGPPVTNPRKIICTGLNYVDHAREVGAPIPDVPVFFPKYDNSLAGPQDTIIPPLDDTDSIDYEAELAIVIGKRGRYIAEKDAVGHIAGAMVLNDVSARNLQLATQTWTGGKAIDTFAPCGPALVTLDESEDLQNMSVRTWVNGDLLQDGHTGQMIFSVAYLVSFLSRIMTLEPGDIIATGTPAGVGKSFEPPRYLKNGDTVAIEIGNLGRLENVVGKPIPDN